MDAKLFRDAIIKFLSGVLCTGLLLFLPAGTLSYPNGWLLMGALFLPMFLAGAVMMVAAPELLRKRVSGKEKQNAQKLVILGSAVMFILGFALAGLGFRLGWLMLPQSTSVVGVVLLLAGYALFAEVLRENEFLSRTVEIQQGQKVVSTGLYGVVRHPMYAATVLLFLSMPLVLGSPVSFAVFLVYPFLLVKRIKNEEALLESGLDGYAAYKQKVRWRLIPFIW